MTAASTLALSYRNDHILWMGKLRLGVGELGCGQEREEYGLRRRQSQVSAQLLNFSGCDGG